MYILLFAALIISGIWLMQSGARLGKRGRKWLGGMLVAVPPLMIALMTFVAELLWYQALGFDSRFWTFTWARIATAAAGALLAILAPVMLLRHSGSHLKWAVSGFAATGGVVLGLRNSQSVLPSPTSKRTQTGE